MMVKGGYSAYVHTYVRTCIRWTKVRTCIVHMYVQWYCTALGVYVRICIGHAPTHTSIYIHTYSHTHTYIHVRMHTPTYVCIHLVLCASPYLHLATSYCAILRNCAIIACEGTRLRNNSRWRCVGCAIIACEGRGWCMWLVCTHLHHPQIHSHMHTSIHTPVHLRTYAHIRTYTRTPTHADIPLLVLWTTLHIIAKYGQRLRWQLQHGTFNLGN